MVSELSSTSRHPAASQRRGERPSRTRRREERARALPAPTASRASRRLVPPFSEVYRGLEPGEDFVKWARELILEPKRRERVVRLAARDYRDFRRVPAWRRGKLESRWRVAAVEIAHARFAVELGQAVLEESKRRRYRKLEGRELREALAKEAEPLARAAWKRCQARGDA